MDEYLIKLLENAESLSDIFEVVKATVERSTGMSRGGIMLGLANLGNQPNGFFGAFYPVGSNIIVMNQVPLQRIKETDRHAVEALRVSRAAPRVPCTRWAT